MINIKKFNKGNVIVIEDSEVDFLRKLYHDLTLKELTKVFSLIPKEQREQLYHLLHMED